MNKLTWDATRNAYRGETEDGTLFVDGDIWAEAKMYLLKCEIAERVYGYTEMDGAQQQEWVDKAINEQPPFVGLYDDVESQVLDVSFWADDMDGVWIEK